MSSTYTQEGTQSHVLNTETFIEELLAKTIPVEAKIKQVDRKQAELNTRMRLLRFELDKNQENRRNLLTRLEAARTQSALLRLKITRSETTGERPFQETFEKDAAKIESLCNLISRELTDVDRRARELWKGFDDPTQSSQSLHRLRLALETAHAKVISSAARGR